LQLFCLLIDDSDAGDVQYDGQTFNDMVPLARHRNEEDDEDTQVRSKTLQI
jgi:hypothetical protein